MSDAYFSESMPFKGSPFMGESLNIAANLSTMGPPGPKGETGNVYFASFKVVEGRLKMYSNPNFDKVKFTRKGSRLFYQLYFESEMNTK